MKEGDEANIYKIYSRFASIVESDFIDMLSHSLLEYNFYRTLALQFIWFDTML